MSSHCHKCLGRTKDRHLSSKDSEGSNQAKGEKIESTVCHSGKKDEEQMNAMNEYNSQRSKLWVREEWVREEEHR